MRALMEDGIRVLEKRRNIFWQRQRNREGKFFHFFVIFLNLFLGHELPRHSFLGDGLNAATSSQTCYSLPFFQARERNRGEREMANEFTVLPLPTLSIFCYIKISNFLRKRLLFFLTLSDQFLRFFFSFLFSLFPPLHVS